MKAILHTIIFFLILILPLDINAQNVSGNLEGRILDKSENPINGVNVIVQGPSLQGSRNTVTDTRGFFRFLFLPNGKYKIKINHLAYQGLELTDVTVALGKTSTIGEVRLEEKTLVMSEVVIKGERPIIDPVSTSSGGNLVSDLFENLPIERNYQNIQVLLPHVSNSYFGDGINVEGATGLENKYFVNGVDVSDPYRGIGGTNLPYNFVKEIEVKSGGYEAEYQSSLGGILNVVTYSGGNEFHGQAFGFYTNNQFAGTPRVALTSPPKGDYSQYDVGLSIGGPILKDRLWFYSAYNPKVVNEDVYLPGLGFYNDRTTTHMFAGKLSYRIDESNQLALSIIGDPSTRRGIQSDPVGVAIILNPDGWLFDGKSGSVNLNITGTHFISQSLLMESYFSLMTMNLKSLPVTKRGWDETLFYDFTTGEASGGAWDRLSNKISQYQAKLKGTLLLEKHTIKFGACYQENILDLDSKSLTVLKFGDSSYFENNAIWKGKLRSRNPSLFLQDSWQMLERLQLNIGLRWDPQFMYDSRGELAQKIIDQYQPRIGFVYQVGELGTQRIFGSFGRFFETIHLNISQWYHSRDNSLMWGSYPQDPRVDTTGGVHGYMGMFLTNVDGLKGQYFDEFTLGYEKLLFHNIKAGVRGIYRLLRNGIDDFIDINTGFSYYGNPGEGRLSELPHVKREYTALELSLEKSDSDPLNFLISYVLSRNYGNYTGLAQTDWNVWATSPNATNQFDIVESYKNSSGLLPNDRTHVFKSFVSYRFDFGLILGGSLIWQSGTPLNEYGGSSWGPPQYIFLKPRGMAGRTPSIWDLNLRVVYDISWILQSKWRPRLIVDVFHVASQREPVHYNQIHYFGQDTEGTQINPNPLYMQPLIFQLPMSARLGIEVNF